jgi:hypothetical protein
MLQFEWLERLIRRFDAATSADWYREIPTRSRRDS